MSDAAAWKRCSTCKKPIAFGSGYFTCNVSTCNRKGTDFTFCSVACWDAHVPVMRHRDAWADEAMAPTAAEWAREQEHEPRRIVVAGEPTSTTATGRADDRRGTAPREVLIVVSKLKHYIRETAAMNTSYDVIEVLSDRVRRLCDAAVAEARAAGRKTVMARDFGRG